MNSTKPRLNRSRVVRNNRSDKTRVVTFPVSFDLEYVMKLGIEDTIGWDFDALALLAKSNTFKTMCGAYDRFRIKRVRGCIDVTKVPEQVLDEGKDVYVNHDNTAIAGVVAIESHLDLNAMYKNPILCCAFDRRSTVTQQADPFSYGSSIFQAMLPGTKIHLNPDVSASTMQEKMSFMPTSVLSKYKEFSVKKSNQIVFDPTFHIRYRQEPSGIRPTYGQYASVLVLDSQNVLTSSVLTTDILVIPSNISLHCMFYVDVIFDGMRDTVDDDLADQQLFVIKVENIPFELIPLAFTVTEPTVVTKGNYTVQSGGTITSATHVVAIKEKPRGLAAVYTSASNLTGSNFDYVIYITQWAEFVEHPSVVLSIGGLDEQVILPYQNDNVVPVDLPEYYVNIVSGYSN